MRIDALQRDDATLRVFDSGAGMPVVFQHGLGGDAAQVAENFPDGPAYRRLTVECRAQGGSTAGSVRPFSIAMFAADVLAACDTPHFVVGGISTGAAIALRLAALHPDRVTALILARPAWVFDRAPANMRPFAEIARLLREHPPTAARERFAASPTARMLATEAPDNSARCSSSSTGPILRSPPICWPTSRPTGRASPRRRQPRSRCRRW